MNLKTAAISLALLLGAAPSEAVTREPAEHQPPIVKIASDAESVMVFRLDSEPTPRCAWDFTDSLTFTHCYPILEMSPSPGKDWNEDLGRLVGQMATGSWNRDDCGYLPQGLVRFSGRAGTSNLVVFTGRCDNTRVGLLMIRPDAPLEYREMARDGDDLLDMLEYALDHAPLQEAVPAGAVADDVRDQPSEGAFVYYDEEPTPVTRVEPTYPEFAKEAQIQGKVTLHVLVGTDGRVRNIKVIKGVPGLNSAAVDAVRHWSFRPARAKGRPVAVWVEIPMDFHR